MNEAANPGTAKQLRALNKRENRNMLLILSAVGCLFLGGAFAVALFVVYAPF